MLTAAQLQLATLLLAAGSLLVSLVVLMIILRRTQPMDSNNGMALQAQSANGRFSPVQAASGSITGLVNDPALVAILTAAILAHKADEAQEGTLTAVMMGALSASESASRSTAGFVIRKIRRV